MNGLYNDFCSLTTANGLFLDGINNSVCYDYFFTQIPDKGGFAIFAGLSTFIKYIKDFEFSAEDIEFLKESKCFSDDFLEFLKDFKFNADIWSMSEGTPIFPNEPVMTVKCTAIEAVLMESLFMLSVNHQSLIATKANRMVRSAAGREVFEAGSHRAHGISAAKYGARAAYIGGVSAVSFCNAVKDFDIPYFDVMDNNFCAMYDNEDEAFNNFIKNNQNDVILRVDTFDTINSGIKNAVKAFGALVKQTGKRPKGILISSGDITYLSKKARKMLDENGYPDCLIYAQNRLDEWNIRDMIMEGAKVDCFIVGENFITGGSDPIFRGSFKISGIEKDKFIPKMRISENLSKLTIPSFKKTWRLFDRNSGKALCDVVTHFEEQIKDTEDYEIFDPDHTWKRKMITDFIARPLCVEIFEKGKCVYREPTIIEIRNYCSEQIDTIWDEVKRFENPHKYYVDLSQKLWDTRQRLIVGTDDSVRHHTKNYNNEVSS